MIGHAVYSPETDRSRPLLLTFDERRVLPSDAGAIVWEYRSGSPDVRSARYAYIYQAAAIACMPLAPSRDLGADNELQNDRIAQFLKGFYAAMAPGSQRNRRIPARIDNKVIYSFTNTSVRLEFRDKNSIRGPTYNPWPYVEWFNSEGELVRREWQPNEIGWQDPITVTVTHNFALLPGPGRFLAKHLVRADGRPDLISPRISRSRTANRETLYTTAVWATATMTNEGLKPVMLYVQDMR